MIDRRVFGSETEFGIIAAFTGPPDPKPENWKPEFSAPDNHAVGQLLHRDRPTQLDGLPEHIDASITYANAFLSNGAELYEDCSHPEYATQEVTRLDDIVAAELAAERILMTFTRRAVSKGSFHKIILSKENIDHIGHSWGYHENYQTLRERMDPKEATEAHHETYRLLGAHLMSRCIYAGEGGTTSVLVGTTHVPTFVMAPKLMLLTTDIDPDTVVDKPLINTRDEPHMDPKYARQHVTCGGPNMNPWGVRMTFGTTSLVLSALEYGLDTAKDIRTDGRMEYAARHLAGDTRLKATIQAACGSITGIDMQYELLGMSQKVGKRRALSEDDNWVLKEWESVLDKLSSDPGKAANEVEWVLKQELGAVGNSPRARGWTALSENKSTADILRKKRWSQWMPSEERIQHMMVNAPEDTRAVVRALFVKHFGETTDDPKKRRHPGHRAQADWAKLILQERIGLESTYNYDIGIEEEIPLEDPYTTSSTELERMMAREND